MVHLKIQHCLIVSIFLALAAFNVTEADELKSVQILFRHGQRTPDSSFQTATGGLTETGKKQMFELGQYFRKRYPNLLKRDFDTDEVSIVSSDTDRAIRSGELAAYGLYKDFNLAASWNADNERIPYEPVPVRAIPPELDRPMIPCAKLDQLFDIAIHPYLDALLERNGELLDAYCMETGDMDLKNKDIAATSRFGRLSAFLEQASFNGTHGLPLSEVTKTMMQLDDFRYFLIGLFKAAYEPPEARKLYSGSLLGLIRDGFQESNPRKITMYAGHDRVMYVLMSILDIYDPFALTLPPYSSAVMFELYQDSSVQREYVKIFYRNDTQVEPREMKIQSCGDPGELSHFTEIAKGYIPVDYEEECKASREMALKSLMNSGGNLGI